MHVPPPPRAAQRLTEIRATAFFLHLGRDSRRQPAAPVSSAPVRLLYKGPSELRVLPAEHAIRQLHSRFHGPCAWLLPAPAPSACHRVFVADRFALSRPFSVVQRLWLRVSRLRQAWLR